MLQKDFCSQLSEAFGDGTRGQIGARHLVAEVHEHFGDAAHACAANADKMNALDLVLHFTTSAHRSATMRVASGFPSERAFEAISRSFSRVRDFKSCETFSGVNSGCGRRIAAPASERKRALAVWWSSTACGNGTSTLARP